jgi:hypothetical protein
MNFLFILLKLSFVKSKNKKMRTNYFPEDLVHNELQDP